MRKDQHRIKMFQISIAEKLTMFNFRTDSVLKHYVLISIVTLGEIFIASSLIIWNRDAMIFHDMKDYLIPGRYFVSFIIILLIFVRRASGSAVLEKINLKYLLLHFLFLSAFIAYALYAIHNFPFPPLAPANFIAKVAHFIKKDVDDHTIRFSFLFFFISVCCHYTLLLAFVKSKKIYYKYLFSITFL